MPPDASDVSRRAFPTLITAAGNAQPSGRAPRIRSLVEPANLVCDRPVQRIRLVPA